VNARAAAAVFTLCLLASPAFADGITAYLEEDYAHTDERVTDETGRSTTSSVDSFSQRYRLALDRAFFPALRFAAGGLFEQLDARTSDGVAPGFARDRTLSAFGTLTLGGPLLSSIASYTYRSEQAPGTPGRLVNDEPSLFFNYRPADLPSFTLRLARTHFYDTEAQLEDMVTLLAQLTSAWSPIRGLSFQYSGTVANPDDRLHFTQTTQIAQSARADFAQSSTDGKSALSAGVNMIDQRSMVSASGSGGTVTTQQVPLGGFSLVEVFPATTAFDVLTANPALVDGNTTSTAGLDIGFSVQLAGDHNPRDVGAQFSDALTSVNTLYVWVDRQLTPQVASAFQWTVWQSDDNQHWSQIALQGLVVFGVFQNRFEITIPTTQARYLKAVVTPLDPAATIDKRFSSVLVTELQLLLVAPVTASQPWRSSTRAVGSVSGRTQVLAPGFVYDFTGILTRITGTGTPRMDTYLLTNGLSYSGRFASIFSMNWRVARQDQDQSRGHEGSFLYSSSLTATELPTLSHSLVYSGQSNWTQSGFSSMNSLSFFNRATPYRGIGLLAGAVYSLNTAPDGSHLHSDTLTLSGSLAPNPKLSFSATFAHADTVSEGGIAPRSSSATNQISGGFTATPVPALYLSAGVTRLVSSGTPHVLANGSISFSPFPGGDLQLALNYLQTYQDPDQVTQLFSPSLRWNIRPSTLLTVSYTLQDSHAGVAGTLARTFEANLQVSL
jgi:hypothetical protein